MYLPPISHVDSDVGLPERVDVVIIGGGIIGACTALELAERGISVALCEKGEIGAEQSSRNWGWVRRMGRDPAELPLAIESRRLWQELRQRLGEEVGYRESGILYLAANPRELAAHETWFEKTRHLGMDSRLLSAREAAALVPDAGRKFLGGLHTPTDGRAEPALVTGAVARAARRAGAKLFTKCAVRGVETSGGRVSGVVTEAGPIRCGAAVLAGGAWTRLFAGNLGIKFPQLYVKGTVARIEHREIPHGFAVGGTDFAFRSRLDGGYTIAARDGNLVPLTIDNLKLFLDYKTSFIGNWRDLKLRFGKHFFDDLRVPRRWRDDQATPFERVRVNDLAPVASERDRGFRNLIDAFPVFAGARITHSWSGLIDVTPNALPVIDEVGPLPGFFIASGFSGHGFGVGPGAGRLVADLVTGVAPCIDPAAFRLKAA
jgi:glycine/D-amino acid oxidase-like deaminating enzyme